MNKAITEGLALMPPAFSQGLANWSRGDGRPGAPSHDGQPGVALVTADADFGGALELQKSEGTQLLRAYAVTPMIPGCYLRVTARIKAVSGNLPNVRIAATPVGPGGDVVAGLTATGPQVTLTSYGAVITVSAIIGSGARGGVDMAWGMGVAHAHVGLDLTGPNGGVVRIDDLVVEDITGAFHRDLMDWVDVRDFGAVGDGVSDDRDAFLAADAAAAGRQILVPAGNFRIDGNLTLGAAVRFEGTLAMAPEHRLQLTRGYDFPTYAAAFGSDDEGLRRALQALMQFTDHVVLDLRGRRVRLDAPIDVHALSGDQEAFEMRRVITGGQIDIQDGPAWAPQVLTRTATYSPAQPKQLTGMTNVAAIPVGARLAGQGVGREVYVTATNPGAGSVTLSQPLYDAEGTQTFTFTRDRFAFDFSGFAKASKWEFTNIEFLLKGVASGIMLPPEGFTNRIADCVFNRPGMRAITSIGRGCQSIFVERNQFISNEMQTRAQDRVTMVMNVNANDARITDNRVVRFAAFVIAAGSGHLISGNHFFGGDNEAQGVRLPGLVLTEGNVKTTINGNYVDNCSIEWTNEHTSDPSQIGFSFGGLTIVGNIFTANSVGPWFRWLIVKPFGPGHYIHGLNVSGNVFRTINGPVERVEMVDDSLSPLNYGMFRNITVQGNAFNGVGQVIANPVTLRHDQNTEAGNWTISPGPFLPFGGWARTVVSVLPRGEITGPAGERRVDLPFAVPQIGPDNNQVRLNWAQASKGSVMITVRVDNPN